MITEEDIKKLKKVFITKKEFQVAIGELVSLITGGFNRVDKAMTQLHEHSDILNNHEHRLDKIEDKIFSTS